MRQGLGRELDVVGQLGQETDGSVTPLDLGMDGIVSKTKDFLGKRSLARADMSKPDRTQLVDRVEDRPPMTMIGHVTSSYHSPNVGRSIALALVKGGLGKKGQKVYAPLEGGKTIGCTITGPVFLDPNGERLRG